MLGTRMRAGPGTYMLRPIAWTIGGLAIVVVAVVLAHAPETGFVDPPPARRGTSSADPIDARVNDPQRSAVEGDVDERSAASPSRTMTLRGRVVDESGAPLANLRVELHGMRIAVADDPRNEPPTYLVVQRSTITDSAGVFAFEAMHAGAGGELSLDPGGDRPTAVDFSMPDFGVDVHDIGTHKALRGTAIVGRIVDEHGRGIGGARVMAFRTFDRPPLAPIEIDRPFGTVSVSRQHENGVVDTSWRFLGPPFPESRSGTELVTRTAPDGSFRIVMPGETEQRSFDDRLTLATAIAVDAPGRAPASFGVWEGPGGESIDTGDHVVPLGVPFRGQVVDARGEAVANAVLLVGCIQVAERLFGPSETGLLSCGTTTDDDGAFEFPHRPSEPHLIAVQHSGARQFTVLDAGRPRTDARIVIPTTTTLEVEVVDARGAPIAKPFLRVVVAGEPWVFDDLRSARQASPTRTIDEGVFVVDDLIEGEVELLVGEATGGFVAKKLTLPHPRLRVEVPDSSPLIVTVVDTATDEPIRGARVDLGPSDLESLVAQAHSVTRGTTSARGEVSLLRRMHASHSVHITHPDYAAADATVEPDASELQVKLTRASSIVGRITENDAVVREPMTVRVEGLSKAITDVRRDVPVDDSGSFRVDRLAAGRYAVRVRIPGRGGRGDAWIEDPREWLAFAEAKVTPGEVARVDIDLTKGSEGTGIVRGRLTVNGVPTAAALSIHNERLPNRTVGSTQSDAAGSFAFAPIPPGRSTLIAARFSGEPSGQATGRTCEVMTIDVPRGQSVEVFPDLVVGTVVGSVVDLGGNPISGALVKLVGPTEPGSTASRDRPGAAGMTDTRGSYTIEWVPEGSYSVTVSASGFVKNGATSVMVERGGTRIHDVTLLRGASLSGRIDAGGPIDPDFSVIVSLRRPSKPDENLPGIGIDRKTGSFSLPDLEPGRYELSVWWVKNATPRTPGPPDSEPRYVRFDGRSNTLLTKTIVVPEGGLKDLEFRIE